MKPLGSEPWPPLDEGTILDMPVTIPRASITEVADDLKARDALLRSFPEVESVVGKAGRAETPTDPAPLDMVETIVNLRPRDQWPKRELRYEAARRQTDDILKSLVERDWIKRPTQEQRADLLNDATMLALEKFDRATRDMTFQDYAAFEQQLAPVLLKAAVDETVRLVDAQGKLNARPQSGGIGGGRRRIAAGGWDAPGRIARHPERGRHRSARRGRADQTRPGGSPARAC